MKDSKKQELFANMVNAISEYKSNNEVHSTSDGLYEKAQQATSEYANYSGITYERACQLALELI